jgi:5'-nucleotidase/UDP-sugar diphosphatase
MGRAMNQALFEACPACSVAMINGGAIRADIAEGPIQVSQVLAVFPFGNTVATCDLPGHLLLGAVRRSLASRGTGGWMQFGGLRFVYDPEDKRVISALDEQKYPVLEVQVFNRTRGLWEQLKPEAR